MSLLESVVIGAAITYLAPITTLFVISLWLGDTQREEVLEHYTPYIERYGLIPVANIVLAAVMLGHGVHSLVTSFARSDDEKIPLD